MVVLTASFEHLVDELYGSMLDFGERSSFHGGGVEAMCDLQVRV
jgi:hypothetical protein